jgi:hypothetical protein
MAKTASSKAWPADKVERRKIDALIPYARNARTHSDEQVAQIAASIREWGWTVPILVDEGGGIIAGHGRVLAARKLGLDDAPVMVAEGWSEAQKRAYVLADNKLALNAGWDMALLGEELRGLDELGFNLELTGFGLDEMADIFDPPSEADGGLSENYSRKIEAPIYQITGNCPSVPDMMDRAKTETLQAEIDRADLPDDVRAFLHFAAERHTVFNFHNIAEFYAHADADTQDLMERSALVIIDFDRAIEEGFVQLSQELMDLAGQEHG